MATATKERKVKARSGGTTLSVAYLKRCLAAVAPAVAARGVKPVLANVLLASGTMTATDLELRISAPLPYDGPALLLPHGRLNAIVMLLDQAKQVDSLTIKQDGSACTLETDNGTWRLPAEDASEFPSVSDADAKPIARLPAEQFARLMDSVRFATDSKSNRYALGGVLVQWAKGTLSFVATDGRRMCVAECEVDQATDDSTTIVPAKCVDTLCRLANGADAVQLETTGTELVAEVDGTTVRARLVDGRFPRWQDVDVQRDVKPSLVVVGSLLHACRQAAICTSEQSRGVTFTVTAEGLHMTSRSAEAGEASATCDLVEPGQAFTVMLDPTFVTQWLGCGSFDLAETIELEAVDKQSAVVLRAQDSRCIVMPLAPSA